MMWETLIIQLVIIANFLNYCYATDYDENIIFPRFKINANSGNQLCNDEIKLYESSFQNLTLWAHEMWDASGKYPSGVLRGNAFALGAFDECVTISGPFKTQYCLINVEVNAPVPHTYRDQFSLDYSPYESVLNRVQKVNNVFQLSRHAVNIGLCIPASCTSTDLEKILNNFLSDKKQPLRRYNVSYRAKAPSHLCYTDKDTQKISRTDLLFILLCLSLIVIVISSTVYDVTQSKRPKRNSDGNFRLAFSIVRNCKSLLKNDTNNPLNILDGIRTILLCTVIVEHRFMAYSISPLSNFDYLEKLFRSELFLVLVTRGDFAVDSIFFIGGLLATYQMLKRFETKTPSTFLMILYRYIRLTPLYGFVIFAMVTLSKFMGSGPIWSLRITSEINVCCEYWWMNLLYINNYASFEKLCIPFYWYLSCDFHLFIFAIIVTKLLSKNKKQGLILLSISLIASTTACFAYTFIRKYPPFLQFYPSVVATIKTQPYFSNFYIKSHIRAQTYIIGMFAGYIYYKLGNTAKRLSKITSHILTTISLLLILVIFVSSTRYFNPHYTYSEIESGLYGAFHRIIWTLGFAGLLFCATHGHIAILKSILSKPFWIPLSKLGFGVYLVHISFQVLSVGMLRSSVKFSFYDLVNLVISDIILSYIVALTLYVLIEAPIRNLFSALFETLTSKQPKMHDVGKSTIKKKNF